MTTSNKVKNAILSGETIERNAWSIHVDNDDHVVIFPPKGAGFKTSLANIDRAVKDFCKKAEMPIPGVKTSHPPKDVSDPDLGPDSSVGEGFSTPSINKKDIPEGAKSSPELGEDTTTNEPFELPSVNKRLGPNVETGGLPDTDLGSDSSSKEPNFGDHVVHIQEDGRVSGRRSAGLPSDKLDPRGGPWHNLALFEKEVFDWLSENTGVWQNLPTEDFENTLIDELNLYDTAEVRTDLQTILDAYRENPDINFWWDKSEQDFWDQFIPSTGEEGSDPWGTDGRKFADIRDVPLSSWNDKDEGHIYTVLSSGGDVLYEGPIFAEAKAVSDEILLEDYADHDILMDGKSIFEGPGGASGRGTPERKAKITDTFSQEKTPDFYSKLSKQGPSAQLLEDIMDPEKWAANNLGTITRYAQSNPPDEEWTAQMHQVWDAVQHAIDQINRGEYRNQKKKRGPLIPSSEAEFLEDLRQQYMAGDVDAETVMATLANPEIWQARFAQCYHGGDLDRDMSDPHRQDNEMPGLVGYDPKNRPSMSGGDKEAVAPPGEKWERMVKDLKNDSSVDNPYAVAWSQYNKSKGARKHQAEAQERKSCGFSIYTNISEDNAEEDGFVIDWDEATQAVLRVESNVLSWLNQNVGYARDEGRSVNADLIGTILVNPDRWEFVMLASEDEHEEPYMTSKGDFPFDPYDGVSDEYARLIDVQLGFFDTSETRKAWKHQAEGFNPPKKFPAKPECSELKLEDFAEDADRKAELDITTGYASKEARRRVARWKRFAQGWNLNITPDQAAVGALMDMGYDAAMASALVSAYASGQELDPESAQAVEKAMQSSQAPMGVAARIKYAALSNADKSEDAPVETADPALRGARKIKAGPKLKEKWDEAGGYNRDMEAESAEELYHLVRSFGSEDPYDWSSYKPQMPAAPSGDPGEGNAAGEKFEGDDGLGGVQARRKVRKLRAVDTKAKDYWKGYFGEYGEELTEAKPKSRQKTKKDEKRDAIRNRVKANISKRARQRLAQESMNPANQPGAQNALQGAPVADVGPAAPAQAGTPAPRASAPAKPAGGAPKGGEIPPGSGDSGLQALGWTMEEIQVMTPEEKQKILQIKLNKPGTKPKTPASPAPAQGAPAKPAPKAPASPAPAPVPASPAPVEARIMAKRLENKLKIRLAQMDLEAPPMQAPQPTSPVPGATETPSKATTPTSDSVDMSQMGSSEGKAFQILQEVRQQEVNATDSVGVAIAKNKLLAQRLMTEVGMTLDEAKKLFGIQNTLKLFQ